MKLALVFSGLILAAAPAAAQVVHQVSIADGGPTVAVRYEPKVENSFRQTGFGPRAISACRWTSTVSVQRIAVGPDGRPIAALTRIVAEPKTRSGQLAGYCDRAKAELGDSEQTLRSYVAAAADADAPALRAELASLASLKTG